MHLKKKLVKTLEVKPLETKVERRKLDCLTYNIWWSFGLTRGNFYIDFWSRFIILGIFVFTYIERFVRFSFKESQMSWQNWCNIWITRNSLELSPKTKLWKEKIINLTWNLCIIRFTSLFYFKTADWYFLVRDWIKSSFVDFMSDFINLVASF